MDSSGTEDANRAYYDAFSAGYEAHRGDNDPGGYHDLLDELESEYVKRYGAGKDVLEVGCGTGLVLSRVRRFARSAKGVDLSPGMLSKARECRAYDGLHEDEITRFFAAHVATFDVIASADTLCYFGDLQLLARSARAALRRGGWIAFTVECGDDVETYRLQPHGRYGHARAYVEQVMAHAGFDVLQVALAVLRRELGSDVQGWVVCARARAAPT